MSILARLAWTILEIAFLYELFLYGIRRYELESSTDPKLPARGLVNVIGSFVAQALTRVSFLASAPLGAIWPFDRPGPGPRRPVVLVHGYGRTRSSLALLAFRLRRDGFGPIHAVGYRSAFADLAVATASIASAIERAASDAGIGSVAVVGHSLGGVLARVALRDPKVSSRVRTLVTIASPHLGTKLAGISFDPAARELRPGSRLLRGLEDGPPLPPEIETTSIFSTFDAVVLPTRNAFLPGAANVEIQGVGHDAMLLSPKVYGLVREALDGGRAR